MGRKGVSLLCAVFTLLCLEVGVSQENCATAIDEQLDCDPFGESCMHACTCIINYAC